MMAVPEETRHEQRPMYLGYICPGCSNPVLLKTTLDVQVHFLQPDGRSPEQAMTYAADAAARALENCGRMQQPLSAFSNVRHTPSASARFRLGSYGTPCPFCGTTAPWQNPRRAVLPISRAPLDSFPRVFFDRSDAVEEDARTVCPAGFACIRLRQNRLRMSAASSICGWSTTSCNSSCPVCRSLRRADAPSGCIRVYGNKCSKRPPKSSAHSAASSVPSAHRLPRFTERSAASNGSFLRNRLRFACGTGRFAVSSTGLRAAPPYTAVIRPSVG